MCLVHLGRVQRNTLENCLVIACDWSRSLDYHGMRFLNRCTGACVAIFYSIDVWFSQYIDAYQS